MTNVQLDVVFYEAAAIIMLKCVTITFAANPQFSTERAICVSHLKPRQVLTQNNSNSGVSSIYTIENIQALQVINDETCTDGR